MKAFSINYKPVFIQFKDFFKFLRYCNVCKKFPIQTDGLQIFEDQFSRKFKRLLKSVIFFIF